MSSWLWSIYRWNHLRIRRHDDPDQAFFLRNMTLFQWWRYFLSAACSPTWPELRTGFPSFSDWSTSSTSRRWRRSWLLSSDHRAVIGRIVFGGVFVLVVFDPRSCWCCRRMSAVWTPVWWSWCWPDERLNCPSTSMLSGRRSTLRSTQAACWTTSTTYFVSGSDTTSTRTRTAPVWRMWAAATVFFSFQELHVAS